MTKIEGITKLDEIERLANRLMLKHNLPIAGWRFKFDMSKRRFGVCKYRSKTIGLSAPLCLLNDMANITDTILHEIAHALVGNAHGHDWVWKQKALEIGCNGNRCYDSSEVVQPKGKYIAICPSCNYTYNRYKQPIIGRKQSCGKCSNGRFDINKLLVWEKNIQELTY